MCNERATQDVGGVLTTGMMTAAYGAPEIRHGGTVYTDADCWSLGVVMLEVFSAYPLFDGDATAEEVLAHCHRCVKVCLLACFLAYSQPWRSRVASTAALDAADADSIYGPATPSWQAATTARSPRRRGLSTPPAPFLNPYRFWGSRSVR